MKRHRQPANRSASERWLRRTVCVPIACALLATGCATIRNGRTQVVAVSSDPPGAQVFVGDKQVGATPTVLDLPRSKRNLTLRFEKDGFANVDVPVGRSPSGWLWGDVLYVAAGGLMAGQGVSRGTQWAHVFAQGAALTFGIDLLTGGAFRLPNDVRATLPGIPDRPPPRAGNRSSGPAREGILLPAPPAGGSGAGRPAADGSAEGRR